MSGVNTAENTALRIAECTAEAALLGVPMYRVLVRDMKASLKASTAAARVDAWDRIDEQTRAELLAVCTDWVIVHGRAWAVRWDQLTQQERDECGATARRWARLAALAGALR